MPVPKTTNTTKTHYTRAETAEVLGCVVSTLYKMVRAGTLTPAIQLPGDRRVAWPRHEVDDLLELHLLGAPKAEIQVAVRGHIKTREAMRAERARLLRLAAEPEVRL